MLSVLVGVLRGARAGATAAVKRAVLVVVGGGGAIACQVEEFMGRVKDAEAWSGRASCVCEVLWPVERERGSWRGPREGEGSEGTTGIARGNEWVPILCGVFVLHNRRLVGSVGKRQLVVDGQRAGCRRWRSWRS